MWNGGLKPMNLEARDIWKGLKDHGIYKGKAHDILKGLEALHIWKSEIEKGNYLFN